MNIRNENGVLIDDNGNSARIAYWGSEAEARKALESLQGCSDCSDCSDCSRCSRCFDCYGCYGCAGCSYCAGCSRCSDCSYCAGCSGCYGCSGCSDMAPSKAEMQIPVIEDIHRKIYEAASQPGCLAMDTWHACETTHCRAGWVVTLAGEAGRALEKKTSPLFAAMQIYKASGYEISPCRFFDSNEDALADMKRLAEGAT